MGWKASCIVASQHDSPQLETLPPYNAELAQRIVTALPIAEHRPIKVTTFEEGIHPDQLTVGAYDGSVIIGHHAFTDSCFAGKVPDVIRAINSVLPKARALAISLHSVVNLYGYAYFDGLSLIRARAGSADDGVFVDIGEWLPEERPLFAKSELRNGERIFFEEINGTIEEFDHSAFGEEFVFELSKRFFGQRIDCSECWDLKMEIFAPVRKSLFQRLFGR